MNVSTWGGTRFLDQSLPSSTPTGLSPVFQISGAGAPVDGVTGLNVAPQGVWYRDTTNGQLYVNEGSAAVPEWHINIQG